MSRLSENLRALTIRSERKYNKEFWDNYNLIKETPLDKKIQLSNEAA